jgi:hypothetical protein
VIALPLLVGMIAFGFVRVADHQTQPRREAYAEAKSWRLENV